MVKNKSSESCSENQISSEKITPVSNQEELSNGLISLSDKESTGGKIRSIMRKCSNNDVSNSPLIPWLDHVIVSNHHRQPEYQLSAQCRLSVGALNVLNTTTSQPNKTAMLIQWRDYVNMAQRVMYLKKEQLPSYLSQIKTVTFDSNIKAITN